MTTSPDPRSDYTAGLRALADLLDQHLEVPLPYDGTSSPLLWILNSTDDQRATLQRISRVIPGIKTKGVRGEDFDLYGSLHGLNLHVIASRDAVCDRVVVGTREITREIPDPAALAAVPTTTVTETVEDVEWVCAPLLSSASA